MPTWTQNSALLSNGKYLETSNLWSRNTDKEGVIAGLQPVIYRYPYRNSMIAEALHQKEGITTLNQQSCLKDDQEWLNNALPLLLSTSLRQQATLLPSIHLLFPKTQHLACLWIRTSAKPQTMKISKVTSKVQEKVNFEVKKAQRLRWGPLIMDNNDYNSCL